MGVFDPFAVIDAEQTEEVKIIDETMFTAEIGGTVFGLDEGLVFGLIIGYFLSEILR